VKLYREIYSTFPVLRICCRFCRHFCLYGFIPCAYRVTNALKIYYSILIEFSVYIADAFHVSSIAERHI